MRNNSETNSNKSAQYNTESSRDTTNGFYLGRVYMEVGTPDR